MLSVQRTLIFFPDCVSTRALKSLRFWKTSNFFMRKKIHVKHEKSSTKMRMYLDLWIDGCRKRPMRSLWIISKGEEAF
jgi:hypothetical protein